MNHKCPHIDGEPADAGKDSSIKVLRPICDVEKDGEDGLEPPEEEQFGVRNPRRMLDPKLPTQREVEEHCLTHLPYRNWCAHCVLGKGRAAPHYKKETREDSLAEVHFDYCFMSTVDQPVVTILMAKERESKMCMATMVPMKGASIEFPARRVLAFLKEIGLENSDVVFKSDQENAIGDLLNNIAKRRSALTKMEAADEEEVERRTTSDPCGDAPAVGSGSGPRTVIESSPVGSSQSNGFIERAIQDEEGQIRTVKADLESKIGTKISSSHDIVPWLVEYAAVLLNRGQVGADGRTAYERLKGKKAALPGMQFGERILWKSNVPTYKRKHKMETDWFEGIFLGLIPFTGEHMVGSPTGVFRPRTVRRVPLEQRWVENLSMICCLPWKHNSRHEAGEEVLLSEDPPVPSATPVTTQLPPRSAEDPKLKSVRSFYVKPYDLDPSDGGIGYTDGCPGCQSIIYGRYPRQAHSTKCRHRVIKTAATNQDVAARVTRAVDRDVDYHSKRLETEDASKRVHEDEDKPEERKVKEPRVEQPFEENQAHTPSSSSQKAPNSIKVKTKFDKKKAMDKGTEGTCGDAPVDSPSPELLQDAPLTGVPGAPGLYQMPSGRSFRLRPRTEVEEEEARPEKTRRVDDDEVLGIELMEALEEAESDTIHLVSLDRSMPLLTCEEPLNVSFLGTDYARDLSEAIACTRYGEVRQALGDRAVMYMMTELCDEKSTADQMGASIFDHNSPIGLEVEENEDRWIHDVAAGTWTRVIVVPRRTMFHPSEGEGGPDLGTLSRRRSTIPLYVESVRDNWKSARFDEALLGDKLWTGRCVFDESWEEMTDEADQGPLASVTKLMKEISAATVEDKKVNTSSALVFTDLAEYSLVDDLSGEALDGHLVTMAKHEELTEVYRRSVWSEAPVEDCVRDTGKPPIPARWVVTNKGDKLHPNVRCRLVAKHLAAKYGGKSSTEDLFAAMPPFELVKALLLKCVQRRDLRSKVRKVLFIDVSKAHLYAPVGEGIKNYVDLPPECSKPGVCGLLNFWLYGMRPASHGWQEEYTKQLEAMGFLAGVASPCCFYRASDDVSCVVHGDDFTFEGPPDALKEVTAGLQKVWLVKVRATLGPEPEDDKEVSILNRVIRWAEGSLLYEADPRHVEKLLKEAGLECCNALNAPGVKEPTSPEKSWFEGESGASEDPGRVTCGDVPVGEGLGPDGSPYLGRNEMRNYRSAVARCNYLAADRFEIAFATKELCRSMASPTVLDVKAVTRLIRFLKGLPRMVQTIPFAERPPTVVEAYVDSDWAGCRRSRKSTSGGILFLGGVPVRAWSSNQNVIALSSGEAEYYAALKGASSALGFQSMLRDLGVKTSITLYTDSSAARGIIHRAGLGKLRHLETGYLWLQSAVKAKKLQVRKVLGAENPADLLTKHLAAADMWKHLEKLRMSPEDGRSKAVPQI